MKKLIILLGIFTLLFISIINAPISEKQSETKLLKHVSPNEDIYRTSDGKFQQVIYSGLKNVQEDGVWKNLSEAKSLKNSGITIEYLETDENYPVEIVDYNYTSVTLKLNPNGEKEYKKDIPVKIWEKNDTKEEAFKKDILDGKKQEKELKNKYKETFDNVKSLDEKSKDLSQKESIKTYDLGFDKILEIGDNSTTLTYNYNYNLTFQNIQMFAKSMVRCNSTEFPPSSGGIPLGCGALTDIGGVGNFIATADGINFATSSGTSSNYSAQVFYANLSGIVSNANDITLINWTWKGKAGSTTGNVSFYFWNATNSHWNFIDYMSGITNVYRYLTSTYPDYTNSSLYTHFLAERSVAASAISTDYVSLSINYNGIIINSPISNQEILNTLSTTLNTSQSGYNQTIWYSLGNGFNHTLCINSNECQGTIYFPNQGIYNLTVWANKSDGTIISNTISNLFVGDIAKYDFNAPYENVWDYAYMCTELSTSGSATGPTLPMSYPTPACTFHDASSPWEDETLDDGLNLSDDHYTIYSVNNDYDRVRGFMSIFNLTNLTNKNITKLSYFVEYSLTVSGSVRTYVYNNTAHDWNQSYIIGSGGTGAMSMEYSGQGTTDIVNSTTKVARFVSSFETVGGADLQIDYSYLNVTYYSTSNHLNIFSPVNNQSIINTLSTTLTTSQDYTNTVWYTWNNGIMNYTLCTNSDICNGTITFPRQQYYNLTIYANKSDGSVTSQTLSNLFVGNSSIVNDTADVYVITSDPTVSYGGATTLETDTGASGPITRSYLRFNIASFISSNIKSSIFYLKTTTQAEPANVRVFHMTNYTVSGTWNESLVTWNNQPCGTGSYSLNTNCSNVQLDFKYVSAINTWYNFSVTSAFLNTIRNNTDNFTLVFLKNESADENWVQFSSKEAGSNIPYLNISYYSLNTAPTVTNTLINNSNFTTSTINFTFNVSDDNDYLTNISLMLDDLINSTIYNQAINTSINNSFNFSISGISDGYHNWYIMACDSDSVCSNSSTFRILVDTNAPNATLLNPINNSYNNTNQNFTVNVSDNLGIKNATLNIWNSTSLVNQTTFILYGTLQSTVGVVVSLIDNAYRWFYSIFDNLGNNYTTGNYTFTKDTTPSNINIIYPIPYGNYSSSVTNLNYTLTEINPSFCWYSNNSGTTNYSIQTPGTNWTGMNSNEGMNTWIVYCNDSAGNINSSSVTFRIDTTPPVSTASATSPSGGASYTFNTWTKNNVKVVMTAFDSGVGYNNLAFPKYCVDITNTCVPTTYIGSGVTISTEGISYIRYYSNDTLNNNETVQSKIIKIDTTSPNVIITNPTNYQNFSYNTSIQVNYSVSDISSGIGYCWYSLNGSNISILNCQNFTINTSEGLNNITVYANDTSGNVNSANVIFRVDTTSPSITIYHPTSETFTSTTIPANFSITDSGVGLSACWWKNDTGNNITIPCSNFTFTQTVEGVHTFYLWANDTLGNTASASSTYTVAMTNPSVNLLYPTNNLWLNNGTNVNFNFTATQANGIWNCSLYGNWTGSWALNQSNTTAISGDSVITYNIKNNMSDGFFSWNAICWDYNQAHSAWASQNWTFGIDTIKPNLNLVYPTNTTYNANQLSINFTSSDTNRGSCWYNINNTANVTLTNCNNITFTANQGSSILYLFVNDSAGNINSTNVTFFVDSINPNATLLKPTNNSFNNTNQNFTVNISDNLGLKNATLNIWNSTSLVNQTNIILSGTQQVVGIVVTLADNVYKWFYSIFDNAGNNYTTSNFTFTKDTTLSNINIIYPINNSNYSSNTIQINYMRSDTNLGSCWYSNDTYLTNTTLSNCINITGITWSQGSHNLTIWANDTAGNINSSQVSFFIDSINPTINFTSPTETSGTYQSRTNIQINVTATDLYLANITIYLFNSDRTLNRSNTSTTSPFFINYTNLADGIYFFNSTARDTFNNFNSTETRNVTIDTTNPLISYGTGTAVDYANLSQNFTYVNLSTTETNLVNLSYYLYNSSFDPTGLVGYWNFDRNTTIVRDLSGNGNDGTNNGAIWNSSGKLGGAYNSALGGITIADSNTIEPTDISISIWVNAINWTNDSVAEVLLRKVNNTNTGYGLLYIKSYSSIVFDFGKNSGTDRWVTGYSPPINEWIFLTVTRNDTNREIYVNGQLYNSTSNAGNSSLVRTTSQLGIGAQPDTGFKFNGTIDEVMIFNRSLSASEISNLYNRSLVNHTTYSTQTNTINWTALPNGKYHYYADILDTANNYNFTSIRNIMLDTQNPNATLLTPTNNSYNNTNQNFTTNLSDNLGLKNATLNIWNQTSGLLINQTVLTFASNTIQQVTGVVVVLTDGIYKWFYSIFDWSGNNYITPNNTIIIDKTFSSISITYPQNTTYTTIPTVLNYTFTEINSQSCWYSTDGGTTNVSLTCGQNVTGLSANQGSNTWMIRMQDLAGNINQTYLTFFVDSISPAVQIVSPTPNQAFSINTISLNYTASDATSGLNSCWYNDNNAVTNTSITCGQNTTLTHVDGAYTITVWANDTLGNVGSDTHTYSMSTEKPAINLLKPVNNNWLNYSNIQFNFTVSMVNSISVCQLYGNWSGTWELNQTITSVTIDGVTQNNFSSINLNEGYYKWNVFCNDSLNNLNYANANFTFGIDTIYPQINLTYPLNTTYTTIPTNLNFISSDTNTNSCWYSINGGTTNITTGCNNITGLSANQGSNTWMIAINDSANNKNMSIVTFFVDSINPTINFTSPTETSGIYQSRNNIQVNVTSVDTYLKNITIYLFNPDRSLNRSNTTTTSPNFMNYTNLADGIYFFNATATDGLNFNSTETRNVTIDTTNPQISYGTGTAVNYANLSQSNVYVNLSLTEINLANITFTLKNSTWSNVTTFTALTYAINYTNINDGKYWYYVNITDLANNKNSTQVYNITLDTHNPNATLLTPTNNTYNITSSQNFTANLSDNLGLKNATLNIWNQTGIFNTTTINYAEGATQQTLGIIVTLVDNAYNWFYSIFDWAGNSFTTQNNTIIIDTKNPGIIINTINNSNYSIPSIQINFTATDTNLDSCWSKNNNGENITRSCLSGIMNNFTDTYSEGMNNLTIYIKDSAGNINSSSIMFIVDTIKPVINVYSPTIGESSPTIIISFNYSVSDANLESCWWKNDTGNNISAVCNENFTFTQTAGAHVVYFWANDSAGNVQNVSISYSIELDAPSVNLNYPADNLWINNGTNVNFNFTATDPNLHKFKNCSLWGNWMTTKFYCYQESANVTNQTGIDGNCLLNYSGSYSQEAHYIYINYSKPSGAMNTSLFVFKHADIPSYNSSIPNACFLQSKLQFRLLSDSNWGSLASAGYCYNGTTWILFTQTKTNDFTSGGEALPGQVSGIYDGDFSTGAVYNGAWYGNMGTDYEAYLYEEAMIWNISQPTYELNQTNSTPIIDSVNYAFLVNLTNGQYIWNVLCTESTGVYSSWAFSNRTLTVDDSAPNATLIFPTVNMSNSTNVQNFSVNLSDNMGIKNATLNIYDPQNQWLQFNDDGYVETTLNSSSSGSISIWFYTKDTGKYGIISLGDYRPQIFINYNNDIRTYWKDAVGFPVSDSYSDSLVLDYNKWNNYILTWGNGNYNIYSNGALVETGTATLPISSSTALTIGAFPGIHNNNYNGLLDEIRTYNKTLSLSEVSQIYSSGINRSIINISGLVSWYDMQDNSNTSILVDVNGNNGTIDTAFYSKTYNFYTDYVPGILSQTLGTVVNLVEGVYNWWYSVFDWAGNSDITPNRTLTIDTTPPVLNIIAPTNSQYNTNNSMSLNFIVSDNLVGLDDCYYTIRNSTGYAYYDFNPTNCQNTTFFLPGGDESYTLTLIAFDKVGNPTSQQVEFYIRTIAPAINLYPSNGINENYLNNHYFNFTSSTNTASISVCQLWGDWSGTWVLNQTLTSVSKTTMNHFNPINLTEGEYQWGVWCNDTLNNDGWSFNNTYIIDTTYPIINITKITPTAGSMKFSFNSTASDLHNITCKYSIFNYLGLIDGFNSNKPFTCNNLTYANTSFFGHYVLTIYATDLAGNINSSSMNFTTAAVGGTGGGGGPEPETKIVEKIIPSNRTYCGDGICQKDAPGNDAGVVEDFYSCPQDCKGFNVDSTIFYCFDNDPETVCIWSQNAAQYVGLFMGILIAILSFSTVEESGTKRQVPLYKYSINKLKGKNKLTNYRNEK